MGDVAVVAVDDVTLDVVAAVADVAVDVVAAVADVADVDVVVAC